MATEASYEYVQKAYIAYYGRPADPSGLEYWATQLDSTGSMSALIDGFGNSTEADTLFGSYTNTAKINAIYQQCFGRDADYDGLMWYDAQLTAGTMTAASIMLNILDGAQGNDATIVANKLTVAKLFTAAIDTASEVIAYSGTTAATTARTWLAAVDETDATVTTATASVDSTITTIESGGSGGATGTTYTLTTGVDSLTGTSANDTFIAIQTGDATETWGSADTIDGAAGTDSLSLINDEGGTAPNVATVTNVENVTYRSTAANGALDMDNMTGVTALTLDRTIGANDIDNIALTTALAFVDSGATMDTTATYKATGVTGSADSASVSLNGVTALAELELAGAVETINISTTGAASTLADLVLDGVTTTLNIAADEDLTVVTTFTSAEVTSLTVTGDSAVTITPSLDDSTATVNASANTGGVNVLIGNVNVTATGGTGDDRFAFAATELTSVDTVDGGDGTDTLAIMDETVSTDLYTEINASSNMEVLEFAATGATTDMAVDTNTLTSIDSVKFSGAAPVGTAGADDGANDGVAAIAIAGNENSDSYEVTGDITGGVGGAITDTSDNDAGDGAAAISVANELDGGANTFSITLSGGVTITGGAGGAMDDDATQNNQSGDGGAGISAATVETINITSSKTTTGTTSNAIAAGVIGATPNAGDTDGAAGASVLINTNGTINVLGDANLDLGTIAGTNATVDASTFTGTLTVIAEAGNNTLIGGSGVDTMTGFTGIDTLTGNGGNDIFIFDTDTGEVDASIVTAADADVITDYTAGDIIRLSGAADSVAGTATGAIATSNIEISAGGKATFAADDDTLAEMLVAVAADADVANDEVVFFEFGSDTYIYGAGDATGTATDDFMIKLTGVTGMTTLTESTSTAGDFTIA